MIFRLLMPREHHTKHGEGYLPARGSIHVSIRAGYYIDYKSLGECLGLEGPQKSEYVHGVQDVESIARIICRVIFE